MGPEHTHTHIHILTCTNAHGGFSSSPKTREDGMPDAASACRCAGPLLSFQSSTPIISHVAKRNMAYILPGWLQHSSVVPFTLCNLGSVKSSDSTDPNFSLSDFKQTVQLPVP